MVRVREEDDKEGWSAIEETDRESQKMEGEREKGGG